MDETQSTYSGDAWMQARLGNAVDALVDRVLMKPQYISDPGQAYGVDQAGNIYQLGQTNGQLAATIQTRAPGMPSNSMLLLLVVVGAVLLLEAN
jgi:hypothetical protein